jgi:OmcA/MtrC family decaheme c-type cytochrome
MVMMLTPHRDRTRAHKEGKMFSIPRTLALLAIAATAVATPIIFRDGVVQSDAQPAATYSAHQKEYYLTQEQKDWIRPGLNVVIESFEIPADRKPVAVVRFVDDLEQPLDRAGQVTPGAITTRFILAWYDGTLRQYTDYTTRTVTSPITGVTTAQASYDSTGAWEDLEIGRARYTFNTVLPEGYDQTRTHTLAIYATRATQDIVGKNYYSNVLHDFRPDGQPVTEVWAAMEDATCNACHDPLSAHGGSRRSVKLCVTCHSPQTIDPDTGNTTDMKVMIHKIHMGENLPSVQAGHPYQIIGNQGSVADFSDVALPQDIRNCTTCHPDSSPEGYIWYSRPNRAACGSCHDDVNWESGENHPAGPQADDQYCAFCHQPEGEREFDASVKGAHTIPTKSSQLRGLNMEILEVTGAAPGSTPTVTFRLTNDDGSLVEPASLNRLRFQVGGPTTDYTTYFRQDATGATVSGDIASYTFQEPIPAEAVGTWTFSADAYRNVTIDDGGAGLSVREAAQNPIYYAAVTDSEPVPRREVVSDEKCNSCHNVLALHGGQRFKVQECAICHYPAADDAAGRPPEEMPAESIHLKWMVHRIHTGEALLEDYTIGGSEGTNFNDVVYPGDRRNCEGCHLAGTYDVPLPEGTLDTPTARSWYTPMKPAAAACLSCHSSVDAAAHAYVNTAPFGEACAACHGVDRDYSVERVHAR